MELKDSPTVIMQTGSTCRVRAKADMIVHEQLPVGTYTVKFDERAGEFFLERISDFELPKKIYGKNTNYARRIVDTFLDRPLSTGVLLSGIKGAGKTLLAKQTSVLAATYDIPTIVINRDWHGDEFNSFIQSISSPAIVLFDEFEKVYDYNSQRKILTLLDGVFPTKKLFLLTTNTGHDVSEFLRNRPGRIYYNFSFDTLGQDFIREYLEDRLNNKDHIEDVLKYTKVFSFFNFDMLAAAVEEMNRYDETLAEVLDVLNITPENKNTDTYEIKLLINNAEFILDKNYVGFQPNSFSYTLWTDDDLPKMISDKSASAKILRDLASIDDHIEFNTTKIKQFDQANNTFVYSIERGGNTVEMHVRRNTPVSTWRYNPDAF